ncbi:tRNA ligase [Wilcoxina mikolae CBS 423.85]|nr:tRNA ligase [Wilcoxina mikolae CBS 423.85]
MSSDPSLLQQQDPTEINELMKILNGADRQKSKDSFSCRKSTFKIDGTTHEVDSWKFQEQDFKKRDLPTYSRGLFTWRDPATGNHRIAVRGYDKFFNIDEIYRTKWDWIQENTKAPYEVTMKENGCIIFISGLPDGTLLVCSKHSTGARGDVDVSHAMVGDKWIEKQLAQVEKMRKDLALALYNANATAVAELCDDSFEEHILAYEKDRAGLYLHGINLNLKEFATYPATEVHKFADEWAFRKIDYMVKDNVADLRKFLEEAAETGSWEGKDVEGFVIRCKARNGPQDPEWHDWFFKYKFEEPYLMYRQWREVTKMMINGKEPRYRKHQVITKEYLKFATQYFLDNKGASDQYKRNHGIIRLRNAFLVSRGLKGSDIIRQSAEEAETEAPKRLLLVPVATIGCGKTTVAHALTKLFGWGHLQNDNIITRKNKPQAFATACAEAFVNHQVVIADRNNHMKRERQQLFHDLNKHDARFVALHYVHYNGVNDKELQDKIRKATRDRVFARGDNHQTIQAATQGRYEIEGIMEGFMGRFQPIDVDSPPDSELDLVIDLDPIKDSRENLETVITELHKAYPSLVPDVPHPEALDEAIKASFEEYKPAIKHTIGNRPQKNQKQPPNTQKQPANNQKQLPNNQKQSQKDQIEYFQISIPWKQTYDAIKAALPEEKRKLFDQLERDNRVQKAFHITLIHRTNSKQSPELWQKYTKLYQDKKEGESMGQSKVTLEKLVWDGRVMAIVARISESEWECTNEVAHVTIGTANPSIKPVEANKMLVDKWKSGSGNAAEVELGNVEVYGTVKAVKPGGRS